MNNKRGNIPSSTAMNRRNSQFRLSIEHYFENSSGITGQKQG